MEEDKAPVRQKKVTQKPAPVRQRPVVEEVEERRGPSIDTFFKKPTEVRKREDATVEDKAVKKLIEENMERERKKNPNTGLSATNPALYIKKIKEKYGPNADINLLFVFAKNQSEKNKAYEMYHKRGGPRDFDTPAPVSLRGYLMWKKRTGAK